MNCLQHSKMRACTPFATCKLPLRCVANGIQRLRRPGHDQLVSTAPTLGYGLSMCPCNGRMQQHRQQIVVKSFLGVGAPEAILVAVVALVVFGPKGLADAAKSLGQTLRAFQPTIREVVEVSQEIKGTLEQELGLDEIRQAATMRPTPRPIRTDSSISGSADVAAESSSSSSSSSALQAVTDEQAKQLDPDIELKRAMSEQAAWGGQAPVASTGIAAAAAAAAAGPGTAPPPAPAAPAPAPAAPATGQPAASPAKDLSTLSLEELEAELAKRKSQS